MKKPKSKKIKMQKGFSLVEMLVALSIVILISIIAVSNLYTSKSEVGGAERVLDEASARIVERRADAVRMNGDDRRVRFEHFETAPLPIDFTDLQTTGSLRIGGTDSDGDCVDDYTHTSLTCLQIRNGNGEWLLSANDDFLKLPNGWQVVKVPEDLKLPLIGDGTNGRGVLATSIGFDETGKAFGIEPGQSAWLRQPTGSIQTEVPATNETPFWAIYFVVPEIGKDGLQNRIPKAAVAVAIHPSGLIERFRFDGSEWIGFKNRTIR